MAKSMLEMKDDEILEELRVKLLHASVILGTRYSENTQNEKLKWTLKILDRIDETLLGYEEILTDGKPYYEEYGAVNDIKKAWW